MSYELHNADCLDWMRAQPAGIFDLTFCSPPYEAARTYGIGFSLRGQDWVDWCIERFVECVRLTRGLVCWVVEGQTRNFRYSMAPVLMMADLHRRGIHLRKPPIFSRVGIPGSGGPDWLRNDYEFIVCATNGGKLPWSDNTACGHPPKWAPGGEMAHRLTSGMRVNQWGPIGGVNGAGARRPNGSLKKRGRPSHVPVTTSAFGNMPSQACGREGYTKRYFNGKGHAGKRTPSQTQRQNGEDGSQSYEMPVLANPGNVVRALVGGGVMGSPLCHENEAPFPESLAEFFIKSFCPPGGKVFDPFCGSGTTLATAERLGRDSLGIDVRESQIDLSRRRIESGYVPKQKKTKKRKQTTPHKKQPVLF